MSEANRRAPREVTSQDNVASRLAEFANTYVVYVADAAAGVRHPVPVTPKFVPEHGLTADHARVLNWAHFTKAAAVASAALQSDKMSGKSNEEKVVYCANYMNNEYEFTSEIGSDFASSVLVSAVHAMVEDIGKAQNVNMLPEVVGRAVDAILHNPAKADVYTDKVRALITATLNTPKSMQKRVRKSSADTATPQSDIEV